MAKPSSNPEGWERSEGVILPEWPHPQAAGADLFTHQGRRTPTENCCRRCKEPGWARGGSWGYRFSCPRSDHAGHGGDGWKRGKHYSIITLQLPSGKESPLQPPKARLYLNVPLSTSWPLRRMWMPSLSREPNAMYSARAQSTVRFFTISPRVFRIRLKPARTEASS